MTRLCTLSSKLCDISLHRLLSREEIFAGNVLSGVQRFSRPLRYCILSPDQHFTLFQNIEKVLSHRSQTMYNSLLHNCISLLIGLPQTRLAVLNAAASMIARLPPYSHISDYMINELHWLPILARVRYKVRLLVAKSQQGLAPKYLCELMSKPPSARSSRPLRSADRCDLLIPWSRTSLSQNRAFAVVGPALWNDSPSALRSVMLQGISSASLRSLKTFIFTSLSR